MVKLAKDVEMVKREKKEIVSKRMRVYDYEGIVVNETGFGWSMSRLLCEY